MFTPQPIVSALRIYGKKCSGETFLCSLPRTWQNRQHPAVRWVEPSSGKSVVGYAARVLRASVREGESPLHSSCHSHPIPADQLLDTQVRSRPGACGFVLVDQTGITLRRTLLDGGIPLHSPADNPGNPRYACLTQSEQQVLRSKVKFDRSESLCVLFVLVLY
jgi:hypothetical protein